MDRKIRRTQYITPFGVGAILDIGQESFVAEDISKWGKAGEKIELKRLSTRLNIEEFKMPPVPKDYEKYTKKVPFYRFPEWLFVHPVIIYKNGHLKTHNMILLNAKIKSVMKIY